VAVHCNSARPSRSALLESDIEVQLRNRAPNPTAGVPSAANSVPDWIRPFLWFFVWFSAIGLVVSLWFHLEAVIGRRVAPEPFFWMLHVGIFVVWFPAIFVAQRLVGNVNRKDLWKVVLKDSPDWMRYMVLWISSVRRGQLPVIHVGSSQWRKGASPPVADWRGFSGHWMAFYSAAFAILYSAARTEDTRLRCPNGHMASSTATYCTRCGQPVMRVR
jgi:hypothetical protein